MPFFKVRGTEARLHRVRWRSRRGHGRGCAGADRTQRRGRARPLILLHGLLLSQEMHRPLAEDLAARGNRVITLDLLGHGHSDRPRDMWRYSMAAYGRQVVALMDHLGIEQAVCNGDLAGRQCRPRDRLCPPGETAAGW